MPAPPSGRSPRPPPPPGGDDDTPTPVPARAPRRSAPTLTNKRIVDVAPREPKTIEESGLKAGFLQDLALKFLYYEGLVQGAELAGKMHLPWLGVVEEVVNFLVQEHYVDLRGGKGFGRASVDFILTAKGREVAKEAIGRSSYVGPAPVPVLQYNALIAALQIEQPVLSKADLEKAFSHLVFYEGFIDHIGPAVNSSRALFLHGNPGNGKTAIAETIANALSGEVFVPYALEIDNQVIKVFDQLAHPIFDSAGLDLTYDGRWVLCHRPTVIVGGELTLETLDLIWDDQARFYEAPFQVKSNGGMLLIDDFGRQRVHPTDLLNRWIVPLEKRIDYLTLHTGKKFEVPFDQLIIFSTNLDPKELVDEAFLRRIKYKIEVHDPSEPQFRDIFKKVCKQYNVPYHEGAMAYIVDKIYKAPGKKFRACHPRDLVQLIVDAARYRQVTPTMTKELIDRAALSFFVDL